jgi:tripartite-type tricarboxylate transporter receptor subunit TctC
MKRTSRVYFGIVAACAVLHAGAVMAQAFPSKPIRVINPAAPGGNSDIFFRLLESKMAEVLGQPLVMDYRPGAGGTVGGNVIARSAPDGYTTGVVAASFVMNPSTFKGIPYNTEKDLMGLGLIVDVPAGLVVHPSLPVSNVKGLIALAKKRPGDIFYSTAGVGAVGHLAGEMLNTTAGIKTTHVAYKGGGPAVLNLISGEVQMSFLSLPIITPHIREGRLRILAQAGEKRSVAWPQVPTMQEEGLKGFVVSSGFGFVGPAGIPDPIAKKLNEALVAALNDPKNRKTLIDRGANPVGNSVEDHNTWIRSEISRWRKVAKAAGITPQ